MGGGIAPARFRIEADAGDGTQRTAAKSPYDQARIHFYFWGLCAGSAQYHFPWGWPEGAPEPRDWFHCILYPDGTPYRDHELLLLKGFRFE